MPSLALEAFASVTGRLIWLALLHSLWIGLFVAAIAWVFQFGQRLSHQARHTISLAALVVVAVGPVVAQR